MNRFILSEEEKERILTLHESAAKRHYLSEQVNTTHDRTYDYKKEGDKYFYRKKGEKTFKKAATGGKAEEQIKTRVFDEKPSKSNTTKSKSKHDLPFKTKEEGDKFREWMNRWYPKTSKNLQLDRSGSHTNSYIRRAWNHKGGDGIKGDIYTEKVLSKGGNKGELKKSNNDLTNSPFKTRTQRGEYINWLSTNLPKTTKKYGISSSSKDNEIVDSLNHKLVWTSGKLKGKEISVWDFYKYKNPNWGVKTTKEKIESGDYKVPNTVPGSDRINKELLYINMRPEYNERPFLIVDPRLNLVLAFDKNHKLIDYSQSVAGADKQQDKLFTRKEWCEMSHPKNKYENVGENGLMCVRYINGKKHVSDNVLADKSEGLTYMKKIYDYGGLAKAKKRYAQPGIYSVDTHGYKKGYLGKEGIPNSLGLSKDGESLGTAIHALVPMDNRITADDELKKLLQKDLKSGEIPQEYISMVEKDFLSDSKKFDLSSGCFNVDPEFIQNPKVLAITKYQIPVFIMSEQDTDYLVQVKPGEEPNFMKDLGGKGGKCISPSSLESSYGEKIQMA